MKVGDIIRLRTSGFGYHVWRVVGEYLGGMGQESVVEIETLDRTPNTEGRMLVPVEILRLAAIQHALSEGPITLEKAKELRICRICHERDNPSNELGPFILGKEYAHEKCIERAAF